jgi:pimeloyl-ACP methyl ester carboxylesterase
MRHLGGLLAAVLLASSCATPGPHALDAPALAEAQTKSGDRMVQVRGAWLRVREMAPPVDESGAMKAEQLPVVFIHGYGSRLEGWKIVQPEIAKTRRTVSFDQRGFGLSERSEGEYGPEAHAADVIALLDELHIEKAIVVGHSYGCGVALRMAVRHPERVAGIVLVSPFALDEQVATAFKWAKAPVLGEYLFTTSFRGFPGEKYLLAFNDRSRFVSVAALDEVQALQAREGSDYAALATVRGMDYASVESAYATITAPVTVVWGEADRVTPIHTLPLFAQKLPQKTKFIRVPATGHMPSWEKPDVVIDAVKGAVP